jgi:hypothetical protein
MNLIPSMKIKFLLPTLLAFASPAQAQYAIDWFTLDGGGGQSSGGAYTLNGTIGQPDATTSSGGAYTLQGGFWGAFAMEVDGAPLLRIVHSGQNIIIAWPNPSTQFQLQESHSLAPPDWTDVNAAPDIVGDEKQVSQTLAPGTRFYRLRKP